jgi:GNAT superfamily N-acetyltransferase
MPLNGAMLPRAAANCAGAYRTWAERMGKPARLWDDLSCGDLGLAANLPPNNATLLRPATQETLDGVLERVEDFFASGEGGGYEIWSLWPLPSELPPGYEEWRCPCMIRERGGDPPSPPRELEIVEADDEATVLEAEALIGEVFETAAAPGSTLRRECLGEDFRVWVARVDGRPVTTATAYIADGFVGIYAVATLRDARRRGYGEAVTWAASLCRPDLPATLQASEMGQPVYERMGYRTVAEFTIWERDRR